MRNLLRGLLCAALAALACLSPAFGQEAAPAFTWAQLKGSAVDLAADAGGDAFAVSSDGMVWRWRHDSGDWGRMSGELSRIAAGSGGKPWGLSPDGTVLRYNGLWWESLEKRARDIALDAANNAYVVLKDGTLARYNSLRGDWESFPGKGRQRIAVTADGHPWTVAEDGSLARHDGRDWQVLPGSARDIGVGVDGTTYIVTADGTLARWDEGQHNWIAAGGPTDLVAVTVAAGGIPWVATSRGAIFAAALPAAVQARQQQTVVVPPTATLRSAKKAAAQRAAAAVLAVASPAKRTDPAAIEFTDTRATGVIAVAIGLDGSVFALDASGQPYRWSNAQMRLLSFPGQLVKIAVDPAGNPWGINNYGRIFHHDGADWRQVRGTASDITVAANGAVIVADANGTLGRYDPATNGFLRIDGNAVFVAAAPDGTPWGLLSDGTVVRCRAAPCDRLGRQGRSLSIGPDGSVFLVSLDNRLLRYNAGSGDWDFIVVPNQTPATVAVGPRGRPWVATATHKLLASTFFDRDESLDLQVAAGTQTPTTGSGDSSAVLSSTAAAGGFVFTKNIRVKTYSFAGNLLGVTVGSDGTVLALDFSGQLWKFNAASRSFVGTTPPPEGYRTAMTGPDGMVWAISEVTDGRIFKQKSSSSWDVLQLPITNPSTCPQPPCFNMNRDLAVAADGTVYAIDTAGTLWRRPANSTVFAKFLQGAYRNVAAGRAGDVWVLDDNQVIRQVVNGKAELRPIGKQTMAWRIASGPDGSVYAVINNGVDFYLARWNAANQSFDFSNRVADTVGVAPDGRPWFTDTSQSTNIYSAQ